MFGHEMFMVRVLCSFVAVFYGYYDGYIKIRNGLRISMKSRIFGNIRSSAIFQRNPHRLCYGPRWDIYRLCYGISSSAIRMLRRTIKTTIVYHKWISLMPLIFKHNKAKVLGKIRIIVNIISGPL